MKVLFSSLLLALCLGLISCASVSVQSRSEHSSIQPPKKIYVASFDTAGCTFKVDREGDELADFKQHLRAMMQAGMVADLSRRLVPAVAGNREAGKRENAWLIRGEFVRVNQGSRLLRGAIGFGAGGTKVETNVSVYDLSTGSTTPILTFSTTGGSGAEPGGITGLATDPVTLVVEVAAGGAGGVAHGVTEDTARTAREITAMLSDYMYRSGWIPYDKWIPPKRLEK